MTIILASSSESRKRMLTNARVPFRIHPADVDEEKITEALLEEKQDVEKICETLAQEKALAVSRVHPNEIVIGSDSAVAYENEMLSKPGTIERAREQLKKFRGGTHSIYAAAAAAQDGKIIWSHCDSVALHFRDYSDAFIENYLREHGDRVIHMAGAAEIEGAGAQLLRGYDGSGDFFTILGMPLLPLLEFLRCEKVLEA